MVHFTTYISLNVYLWQTGLGTLGIWGGGGGGGGGGVDTTSFAQEWIF